MRQIYAQPVASQSEFPPGPHPAGLSDTMAKHRLLDPLIAMFGFFTQVARKRQHLGAGVLCPL